MRRILLACASCLITPAIASAQPGATDPAPLAADPPPPVADPTAPAVTPSSQPEAPPAAPPVAVVAPQSAPVEDLGLAGLELDPAPADERLNLYGFADVTWRALLIPRTSVGANYFPKENTFLVGNVNLYATKKLSRRWRSLLEVRFLYAPIKPTADGTYQSTTAPDPADLERPIQWGGISIERVYLEYEINQWLTIQAGSFLTPYGIWNVDHGSPTIIPVTRPYIIGESLFPQQQTGLHLYGKRPVGNYQLRYDATLTNGRGTFAAVRDFDDNKAIGGRLELEAPWLDGVRLGISGYLGRFTDRPADVIVVDPAGKLVNTTPPGTSYDERAWGLDLLAHRGPLHIQAELVGNDRHYRTGARAVARGGFAPNGRYVGAYALVGYRLDRWWQMMPFVELEVDRMRSSPELGEDPVAVQATGGLNFRPDPSVALKLEYVEAQIDAPITKLTFRALMTQASWAF